MPMTLLSLHTKTRHYIILFLLFIIIFSNAQTQNIAQRRIESTAVVAENWDVEITFYVYDFKSSSGTQKVEYDVIYDDPDHGPVTTTQTSDLAVRSDEAIPVQGCQVGLFNSVNEYFGTITSDENGAGVFVVPADTSFFERGKYNTYSLVSDDCNVKDEDATFYYPFPGGSDIEIFSGVLSSILNQNSALCFVFSILIGVLAASMYSFGMNPLGMLDIVTPKFKRIKPIRKKIVKPIKKQRQLGMKSRNYINALANMHIAHKRFLKFYGNKNIKGKPVRNWLNKLSFHGPRVQMAGMMMILKGKENKFNDLLRRIKNAKNSGKSFVMNDDDKKYMKECVSGLEEFGDLLRTPSRGSKFAIPREKFKRFMIDKGFIKDLDYETAYHTVTDYLTTLSAVQLTREDLDARYEYERRGTYGKVPLVGGVLGHFVASHRRRKKQNAYLAAWSRAFRHKTPAAWAVDKFYTGYHGVKKMMGLKVPDIKQKVMPFLNPNDSAKSNFDNYEKAVQRLTFSSMLSHAHNWTHNKDEQKQILDIYTDSIRNRDTPEDMYESMNHIKGIDMSEVDWVLDFYKSFENIKNSGDTYEIKYDKLKVLLGPKTTDRFYKLHGIDLSDPRNPTNPGIFMYPFFHAYTAGENQKPQVERLKNAWAAYVYTDWLYEHGPDVKFEDAFNYVEDEIKKWRSGEPREVVTSKDIHKPPAVLNNKINNYNKAYVTFTKQYETIKLRGIKSSLESAGFDMKLINDTFQNDTDFKTIQPAVLDSLDNVLRQRHLLTTEQTELVHNFKTSFNNLVNTQDELIKTREQFRSVDKTLGIDDYIKNKVALQIGSHRDPSLSGERGLSIMQARTITARSEYNRARKIYEKHMQNILEDKRARRIVNNLYFYNNKLLSASDFYKLPLPKRKQAERLISKPTKTGEELFTDYAELNIAPKTFTKLQDQVRKKYVDIFRILRRQLELPTENISNMSVSQLSTSVHKHLHEITNTKLKNDVEKLTADAEILQDIMVQLTALGDAYDTYIDCKQRRDAFAAELTTASLSIDGMLEMIIKNANDYKPLMEFLERETIKIGDEHVSIANAIIDKTKLKLPFSENKKIKMLNKEQKQDIIKRVKNIIPSKQELLEERQNLNDRKEKIKEYLKIESDILKKQALQTELNDIKKQINKIIIYKQNNIYKPYNTKQDREKYSVFINTVKDFLKVKQSLENQALDMVGLRLTAVLKDMSRAFTIEDVAKAHEQHIALSSKYQDIFGDGWEERIKQGATFEDLAHGKWNYKYEGFVMPFIEHSNMFSKVDTPLNMIMAYNGRGKYYYNNIQPNQKVLKKLQELNYDKEKVMQAIKLEDELEDKLKDELKEDYYLQKQALQTKLNNINEEINTFSKNNGKVLNDIVEMFNNAGLNNVELLNLEKLINFELENAKFNDLKLFEDHKEWPLQVTFSGKTYVPDEPEHQIINLKQAVLCEVVRTKYDKVHDRYDNGEMEYRIIKMKGNRFIKTVIKLTTLANGKQVVEAKPGKPCDKKEVKQLLAKYKKKFYDAKLGPKIYKLPYRLYESDKVRSELIVDLGKDVYLSFVRRKQVYVGHPKIDKKSQFQIMSEQHPKEMHRFDKMELLDRLGLLDFVELEKIDRKYRYLIGAQRMYETGVFPFIVGVDLAARTAKGAYDLGTRVISYPVYVASHKAGVKFRKKILQAPLRAVERASTSFFRNIAVLPLGFAQVQYDKFDRAMMTLLIGWKMRDSAKDLSDAAALICAKRMEGYHLIRRSRAIDLLMSNIAESPQLKAARNLLEKLKQNDRLLERQRAFALINLDYNKAIKQTKGTYTDEWYIEEKANIDAVYLKAKEILTANILKAKKNLIKENKNFQLQKIQAKAIQKGAADMLFVTYDHMGINTTVLGAIIDKNYRDVYVAYVKTLKKFEQTNVKFARLTSLGWTGTMMMPLTLKLDPNNQQRFNLMPFGVHTSPHPLEVMSADTSVFAHIYTNLFSFVYGAGMIKRDFISIGKRFMWSPQNCSMYDPLLVGPDKYLGFRKTTHTEAVMSVAGSIFRMLYENHGWKWAAKLYEKSPAYIYNERGTSGRDFYTGTKKFLPEQWQLFANTQNISKDMNTYVDWAGTRHYAPKQARLLSVVHPEYVANQPEIYNDIYRDIYAKYEHQGRLASSLFPGIVCTRDEFLRYILDQSEDSKQIFMIHPAFLMAKHPFAVFGAMNVGLLGALGGYAVGSIITSDSAERADNKKRQRQLEISREKFISEDIAEYVRRMSDARENIFKIFMGEEYIAMLNESPFMISGPRYQMVVNFKVNSYGELIPVTLPKYIKTKHKPMKVKKKKNK